MLDYGKARSNHRGIAARLYEFVVQMLAPQRVPKGGAVHKAEPAQMYALDVQEASAVLIVGEKRDNARLLVDCLRDQGIEILTCKSLGDVRSRNRFAHRWRLFSVSHLVVDVDDLGGIETIYSDLRRIRDTIPDLAVILISSRFAVDDFSLERLALCDASIRAKSSFAGIEFALSESLSVNNKAWQARLASLSP